MQTATAFYLRAWIIYCNSPKHRNVIDVLLLHDWVSLVLEIGAVTLMMRQHSESSLCFGPFESQQQIWVARAAVCIDRSTRIRSTEISNTMSIKGWPEITVLLHKHSKTQRFLRFLFSNPWIPDRSWPIKHLHSYLVHMLFISSFVIYDVRIDCY